MRPFNFFENVGAGGIRQLEVERHEIDAVIVNDGQGMAAVVGCQNVEVLFENLRERSSRRGFVVDDEDC